MRPLAALLLLPAAALADTLTVPPVLVTASLSAWPGGVKNRTITGTMGSPLLCPNNVEPPRSVTPRNS